jgi:hypothetical protein
MLEIAARVEEVSDIDAREIPEALLRSTRPLVLRGLITNWPLVRAGRDSAQAAMEYLNGFYRGAPVRAQLGAPEIAGRFFYNEDLSGFNFRQAQARLDTVFNDLARYLDTPQAPAIYVGATAVDAFLPGFRVENDLNLGGRTALASAWMGNRSRVSAHYDVPDNLACVAVGHRRFTLFPPEQLANLYVGPVDFTPAGQAISLVDFARPDLQRFPRFAKAIEAAQVAELGPGDAIFIPSLWWHHIEALDAFNVLVNYWWRTQPGQAESPLSALMLAMMSLRELPVEQRRAWQEIFRHYVFEADENTAGHIPENARRVLAPLDDAGLQGLREQLLARLTSKPNR